MVVAGEVDALAGALVGEENGHEDGEVQAETALELGGDGVGFDGGGRGAVLLGAEPAIGIRLGDGDEASGLAVLHGRAAVRAVEVHVGVKGGLAGMEVEPHGVVADGSERPGTRGFYVASVVGSQE